MRADVLGRIREAVPATTADPDATGQARVTPGRTEDVAAVLALATAEGWTVRLEGRGTWCPPDAPADLVLSTERLDRIVAASRDDLVATVEAGAPMSEVSRRLRAEGVWLALDPPGRPDRSLGSVVATGTAGPLRHRFGPVRDHLLGCTFVTADGRVLRPGGAVVKNVAGYDLTRLMAGGFGAFGVITSFNLRLRAVPETDLTMITRGARDDLTAAARDLVAAAVDAVSLELFSPTLAGGPDWLLMLRLAGTEAGVRAEANRVGRETGLAWTELDGAKAEDLARSAADGALGGDVTLRLAVLLDGMDPTLDLLDQHLGLSLVSAGAGIGTLRWTGDARIEPLRALRAVAAAREIPLTLERAPWALCREFGHFGGYREGVGALVTRLRHRFDPAGILLVPLDAAGG